MDEILELEPVLFQSLEAADDGYNRGYRFQVVRVDGERRMFELKRQAAEFMGRQGMRPVTDDEMEEIRREIYIPE